MDNKHYLKRIAPQHKKKNFMSWLDKNLTLINHSEKLIQSIDDIFDLEKAVGKQLDVLGDITGRQRLLDFEPEDGSSSYLDDDMYRVVIKAKIGINHWDGTIPSMVGLWENIFPEYDILIKDNQDMTMTVSLIGKTPLLLRELAGRHYIVPKPEGVRINYEFIIMERSFADLYVASDYTALKDYDVFDKLDLNIVKKSELVIQTVDIFEKEYIIYNKLEKELTIDSNKYLGIYLEIDKEYNL